MNTVKTKIKGLLGEALLRTGLWRRYMERMARRGEAIILTYHRVIEKWSRTLDYSQPGMVVTADTFARQLTFLKQHFHIVSLSSLVNPKSEVRNPKSFDRPLCAVTFDDGWRDNYEIAFPILQKHSVPATIFLTTDFIGTDRAFWHTELMYLLMHGDVSRYRLLHYVLQAYPSPVNHRWRRLARSAEPPSAHDMDPLVDAVKVMCGEDEIDNLILDVKHALGTSGPLLSQRRFFLDWEQVREMATAGIEIGSHGCSHRILTRLKAEEVEDEIVRSKAIIESHIGQEVRHFACPDGASNRSLIALIWKAGYRTTCLCASGQDEGRFAPVTLQRAGMHEGVSAGGDRSFSTAALLLWLCRAPSMRVA